MDMISFKLAVLSLDNFSDAQIEKFFLDLEVTSEDDIREAVGIISLHRPQLIECLTSKYFRPNATQQGGVFLPLRPVTSLLF